MRTHDWYVANRSAFVIRTLESEEEQSFSEHLSGCEECTHEVARLEQDLAWLPMAVTPGAPRSGFARRATVRILRKRSPWRQRLPWLLAAAGLLAAVGLGFRDRAERGRLQAVVADRDRRLAALTDTLSVLRQAHAVQQASISMPGHRGGLLIVQDPSSHRWTVIVHGLPPAPSGNIYQFWFITETGMVRSVEVNADTLRPAFMTLPMPPASAPIMGAALSVEPALSRSSEPMGPMLAHIMF
jgi:hypothetical protein